MRAGAAVSAGEEVGGDGFAVAVGVGHQHGYGYYRGENDCDGYEVGCQESAREFPEHCRYAWRQNRRYLLVVLLFHESSCSWLLTRL